MVLFTQLGFPDAAKGRTALGALITRGMGLGDHK